MNPSLKRALYTARLYSSEGFPCAIMRHRDGLEYYVQHLEFAYEGCIWHNQVIVALVDLGKVRPNDYYDLTSGWEGGVYW